MRALTRRERAAMEAVAKHRSATWEMADAPHAATIEKGRQRIAVKIATMGRQARAGIATHRLRLDRVALRLVKQVRDALNAAVPDNATVMFTITAPIKLPAKTASSLEEIIRDLLARQSAPAQIDNTIHGNRIRVRLAEGGRAPGRSRVIGFVHNPGADPGMLFDAAQSMIACLGAGAARRVARAAVKGVAKNPKKGAGGSPGKRWLLIADESGLADVQTCRAIYSQLSLATDFDEILVVLPNGSVASLSA